MHFDHDRLTASPTDLANFLACRHKTALDLLAARGELEKPTWVDPLAAVLRQRGEEHEHKYVSGLRREGLRIVDLGSVPRDDRPARTLAAMRDGADAIVQAALSNDRWLGYADVLRRVETPSPIFGAWSYEAHDTKLSRETRGGTILQLCLYTELIGEIQGSLPEHFRVITPSTTEPYRFDDFSAYYRQVKTKFLEFLARRAPTEAPGARNEEREAYPDPVHHCDFCRWFQRCNARRRKDDHLSFVAGLSRIQRVELEGRGIATLAALAEMPVPLEFQPKRGSKDTYEKLCRQAKLQLEARTHHTLVYELLPVEPPSEGEAPTNLGLAKLPAPSPGDLFLDLEGDPFARPAAGNDDGQGGREYLFGLGRVGADGSFIYSARWAFTDDDERKMFESIVDEIKATIAEHPGAHVYHYAPYEPAAFKRLMGRYATREVELDELLRGKRFVDLYAVVRQALRAGVESYSIKKMEPFYAFQRDVTLDVAGDQRRVIELALELGATDTSTLTPDVLASVEGYNKDDCRSTHELRNWLESVRTGLEASGTAVPRPPVVQSAANEEITERKQQVEALRAQLLANVPADRQLRSAHQRAMYLLAYLLDWHDREDKVGWWEYFRLIELPEEDLADEPNAVIGLQFVEQVRQEKRSFVHRYRYAPDQEMEIRAGDELHLQDGNRWADVVARDRDAHTLDVLVGPKKAAQRPTAAFAHTYINPKVMRDALFALGTAALHGGATDLAMGLLQRRPPRLKTTADFASFIGRTCRSADIGDVAVRLAGDLDRTTLAIQGPPGSGKTYTGGRMICELARQGKKIGVVATGHKVIRNLLKAAWHEGKEHPAPIRLAHKTEYDETADDAAIAIVSSNEAAIDALQSGAANVLGGTSYMWARPEFADAVDVLFVDEAGQLSLANALAASQAADSLVLLGDPQQLEQPNKGSHPDGVGVSVLQHVLGEHKTMPPAHGLFLPITWRLTPAICRFTSELFYENKLTSKTGLEKQLLTRPAPRDLFDLGIASDIVGAGLWVVAASHDGRRNACEEEVEVIAALVDQLLAPGSDWVDQGGVSRHVTPNDILIVAPFNAQVSRLQEKIGGRVGTVDKFQGQEAPVVIYSMATSRPEDAPHGLEFLYSLNRLNVATSRAKCACILVANPRLFEPECRTPRQMRLANALCRYREMTRT